MSAQQTKEAATRRIARMAPAVPNQRGGGAAHDTSVYCSRRTLECVAGAYAWR